VFATVHPETGTTHALILPLANTRTMQLYLADFAASLPTDVVALLVLDGASWHRSPKLLVPDNLRLVFLPPYTPELNPAEHLWPLLREVTANRAFADIDALETCLADRCVWLSQHLGTVSSSTSFRGYR
jgi:transposase